MKSALRIVALLLALALPVFLTGCQPPNGRTFPPNFTVEDARKMEATDPQGAFAGFLEIKKRLDPVDRVKASEALLEAAQFASSPAIGTTEEVRAQGETQAREAYKLLLKEYPETPAAKGAPELLVQVENRIDARNRQTLSWKVVDTLVAATGRLPHFSYWLALLLIAVFVKLITLPLTLKMYKSQREMQRIQPLLKDIQQKYKGKPEMNQKVMEVYKEHGVNPFASCFPMLIQMPFLILVYNTIRVYEIHFSHGKFLWIGSGLADQYPGWIAANLSQFDMPLLLLYAASNYLTMKLTPAADPQAAQQQKTMSIMMTGMMIYMFMIYRWSAAFIFYWLVLNIISAYQQYTYIYKPNKLNTTGGGDGTATITLPADAVKKDGEGASKKGGESSGSPVRTVNRTPTPVTPVPGGDAMRPRPRRKNKR